MSPNEAIGVLKLINLKGVHPFYDWEEMLEVRDTAIKALEKQIPQKTTKRQYVPNGTLIYGHCPNCDCFTKNFFKYCGNCGQALDWSDTE